MKRKGACAEMKLPVETFVSGTIVQVDFPYRDKDESKSRPAVVMDFDENVTHVILLQVTSHEPRTQYDYEITVYEDTGLSKEPSVVRCNCVYTIPNDQLLQKIGILTRNDLLGVELLYNQALEDVAIENYN